MKEFDEVFMAGLERDAVEEVVEVPRLQPRKGSGGSAVETGEG